MKTALLVLALLAVGDKDPDDTKINIDVTETPITKILDQIRKDTGIPIEADAGAKQKLNGIPPITVSIQDLSVTDALKRILLPHGLTARAIDRKKVLISPR